MPTMVDSYSEGIPRGHRLDSNEPSEPHSPNLDASMSTRRRTALGRTCFLSLLLAFAGAVLFAPLHPTPSTAQSSTGSDVDSDQDGLTDVEETRIYATNPRSADTDGDGQTDGDEIRAGTDPLSPDSVLKILGSPQPSSGKGWSLRWTSVAGRRYQLQRSEFASGPWRTVSETTASGATSTGDDLSPNPLGIGFYRVRLADIPGAPVLSAPVPLPNNGWRFTWTSTEGTAYRLERAGALPPTLLSWEAVATKIAQGPLTVADDVQPPSGRQHFYRVVVLEDGPDTNPPTVSFLPVVPASATSEGIVTLQISAQDDRDVAQVRVYDGSTLLGNAAKISSTGYRFFWPVSVALKGTRSLTARALDSSGNIRTSAPVSFSVSITQSQNGGIIGNTDLRGDRFTTNGLTVIPTGNVRAGLVSFPPEANLFLSVNAQTLSGNGSFSLPGLGLVFQGPFELNLNTGLLKPLTGFAGPYPTIELSPRIKLSPRSLVVDVNRGDLTGEGSFLVSVSNNTNQVAVVDGHFHYDAATQEVDVHSTAGYAGVEGTGDILIHIGENTFELTGEVVIHGGTNTVHTLSQGRFNLQKKADGTAEFLIAGKPTIPSLAALGVSLTGIMDLEGRIELDGTGAGALGDLSFSPLLVKLLRLDANRSTVVSFSGSLAVPRLAYTSLKGLIRADGSLANLTSTAEIELGNGLRIRPKRDDHSNAIPVITLLSSSNGVHRFQVSGTFLTPEAGGVKPVEVEGPLFMKSEGGTTTLLSMSLTNRLPMLNWPLPKQIKLGSASVALLYTNNEFMARMKGSVVLSRESDSDIKLGMDVGLGINSVDPEDIVFDAVMNVDGLGVAKQVYLGAATFELLVGSKPPRGALALLDGSIGFLPTVPIDTTSTNGTGTNATQVAGGTNSPTGTTTNAVAETTNAPTKLKRENFQLFVEHAAADLQFSADDFVAELTNGTLRLPPIFTNLPAGLCPGQGSGPSIGLKKGSSLLFELQHDPEPHVTLRATGSLVFNNIVVFPNLKGFAAEMCRAELNFNPGGLPFLTNLDGTITFPFPGNQTNKVRILNGAWALNGFPSGTLALGGDLRLYSNGAVAFTLLGRQNTNCPNGLSVTAAPAAPGKLPKLTLTGGIEFTLPADVMTTVEGDKVRAIGCGSVTLDPDKPLRPELSLPTLAVGGTFHLGGANGLILSNALLTLHDADNFFQLGGSRTASLAIEGTIFVPKGPAFTLQDAKLTFFDPERPPRFSVAGMGYNEASFEWIRNIPMRVQAAALSFKNPEAQVPDLFRPGNILIRFSSIMSLPSASNPVIAGAIDDMTVKFSPEGIPSIESLHGLTFSIGDMKLPPLEAMGGKVHIRDDSAPHTAPAPALADITPPSLPHIPDPTKIFFAGSVEGSYDGYKLKMLMAFSLQGVGGVCIDFNAGSVGIPIDGGLLGGIILSGASGGYAFNRGDADPCDFTAWLDANGNPKDGVIGFPAQKISWEDLAGKIKSMDEKADKFHQWLADHHALPPPSLQSFDGPSLAGSLPHIRYTNEFGLPCPGDCPPPTVNIFCQPHPNQERFPKYIIFKFSSIEESTLNALGFTPGWVESRFNAGGNWAAQISHDVVHGIRTEIVGRIPQPDPSRLGGQAAQELKAIIDEAVDKMEAEFVKLILEKIASEQNAQAVYNKIRDLAYEGAPCQDVSLSVSGTFTYEAVSSFLSGTVGGSITSAGNAGVTGKINLLGVPVGTAKMYIAATDDQGSPNPSMCGEIDVSFGPFSFGGMRAAYACQGCTDQYAKIVGSLFTCLSDDFVRPLVAQVVPRIVVLGKTRFQILSELTPTELLVVVGRIYANPNLSGDVRQCFRNEVQAFIEFINPEMLLCGEVKPKLFGLGLGPSLMSAGMQVDKHGFVGAGSYSPSFLVAMPLAATASTTGGGALVLAAGPLATSLFAQDQATYGYALEIPDPVEILLAGIDGKLSSVSSISNYVEQQFNLLLQDATYTFEYTLSPLGFKTVDAQSRVLMPNFLNHPAAPGSQWVRPENRILNPALPSRLDLVLSALTNHLPGSSLGLIADPQWKGSETDLNRAFAGNTNEARLQGLSLLKDYFPHGGVIGGGYIQIPRALYETPPKEVGVMLDSNQDILNRLSAGATYLFDYVLKSDQAGSLGFYVPAPNPPFFKDAQGNALTARVMMEALNQFDASNLKVPRLYPLSEYFMRGYFDGKLLGIPVAQGSVEMALADADSATRGLLRVAGNVPKGSWLDPFVAGARLSFELQSAQPVSIEAAFSNVLDQITMATNAGPNSPGLNATLNTVLERLGNSMPKVKLEADLPLTLPDPIDDILAFTGATHLYAYSPAYEPTYQPGNQGPLARVHREGGIAFQGNADLRVNGNTLVSIPNAELSVVPQPSGAPSISGQFVANRLNLPPLGLNNAQIDFSSSPNPQFFARGILDPLNMGFFSVQPLVGNAVTGRLEVVRTGQNSASAALKISPARLNAGLLVNQTLLLHGTNRTDPFTFSSSGPWTATVEITNGITLQQAGIILVQIESPALLSPITFQGNGTNDGSFTANLGGGTTLTLFPGRTYEQTLQLKRTSSGQLTVRSDGTFTLTGQTESNFIPKGLPGLSIAQVGANAGILLTQDQLVLTGSLGGGVLTQIGGPSFTANGSLTLTRGGVPTVTSSAAFSVQPFGNDQFGIEGPNRGPITATLNNAGLNLSGARMFILGITTNSLPPFTVAPGGDFGIQFGPFDGAIGGYASAGLQGRLGRTNGVWTAQGVTANLQVPALVGAPAVQLRGGITNDGTFFWSGTLASGPGYGVNGTSFSRVGGGATVELQRTRSAGNFTTSMRVTGSLSGGSLAGFTLPSNQFTFGVGTDGVVTLSSALTLQPTWFGIFRLSGQNNTAFQANLNGSALSFPNGLELAVSNIIDGTSTQVQSFPISFLSINPDGSFSTTFSSSGVLMAGFNLRSASLTLRRTGSGATPPLLMSLGVNAILNDIGGPLPAFTLDGSVTNNGALRLAAIGQSGNIGGFAFVGANAVLTRIPGGDGLFTIDGQLNVLPTVTARLSGNAMHTAAGTSAELHYSGPATVPGFTLDPASLDFVWPAGGPGTMRFAGSLNLPIGDPGLQLLGFNGVLQTTGDFALTNIVDNLSLFGVPINSVTNVLRRGDGGYANGVISDVPIGYWRLGELSGTKAKSEVGTTMDGTYRTGKEPPKLGDKGALPGDKNPSVTFTGSQSVLIPNQDLFTNLAPAMTVEAWIRVDKFDSSWQTIISKGDSSWRLQRDGSNNRLAFDTDGLNPPYLPGNKAVNDGQWHHVAAVYDGLAKYLYVDGELDAMVGASGSIQNNTFPVVIGDNEQTGSRGWVGGIDEVALYRFAVSPLRIRDHYQAGGGTVISSIAHLGYPGTDKVVLQGSIRAGGGYDFSGFAFNAGLGGFPIEFAYFHAGHVPGQPAVVFGQGNLSLPGFPSALLKGTIKAGELLDLQASVPSANLFGFTVNNLGFHLGGTASAASMDFQTDLEVTGLGSLHFSGPLFNTGEFRLEGNPLLGNLFSFPINNGSLHTVFQHQAGSYRSVISGDPIVPKDLGDSPAGYWRLNETSGTTIADSKKTIPKTTGTLSGGVTLGEPSGISGSANAGTSARFDGNTGVITISGESAFDFVQKMAVEAWIKVSAWTREWQAIVTKGDSTWRLTRYGTSSVVSFETSGSTGIHSLPGQTSLADGQWHHVVGVCDGVGKYLYVDGALEAFAAYNATLNQNSAPVMIGANSEAPGRNFNGWIDEVAVYNHALSPSDVLAHYLAGGGTGIGASSTLALPGFQTIDIGGLISRSGGASLVASTASLNLPFLSFDNPQVVFAKRPGFNGQVQMSGSVTTSAGTFGFAGGVDTSGGYSFEATPAGSFDIAKRTFDYNGTVSLTRTRLSFAAKLNYGAYSFSGIYKIEPGPTTSFSGTTSGNTGTIQFGLKPVAPPTFPPTFTATQPDAKFAWNATAGFDGSQYSASASGDLTVTFGGTFNYHFDSQDLPDTGNLSLKTPRTFTDPAGNVIGTFCFDLINKTKCP